MELGQIDAQIMKAAEDRFFSEFISGDLNPQTFQNYLILEHNFVQSAARLTGLACYLAPSMNELRDHASALIDLAYDQNTFFEVSNENNTDDEQTDVPEKTSTNDLENLAARIARTYDYPQIVAFFFATEYFYLHWCSLIDAFNIESPERKKWIQMHQSEKFETRVRELRRMVDRCIDVDAISASEVLGIMSETIEAERSFHDLAYIV